jgi:Fe-S-cluster-containing dehydrogenase component
MKAGGYQQEWCSNESRHGCGDQADAESMQVLRATGMERCIGCHSCSLACARLVYGSLSLERSGIRIRPRRPGGAGFEAVHCQACNPAPCAQACPGRALTQRRAGGVRFDPEWCTHCGACGETCPEGAVHFDPERRVPVFCIHCGWCAGYCPQGCLEMAEADPADGHGHG